MLRRGTIQKDTGQSFYFASIEELGVHKITNHFSLARFSESQRR